MRICISKSTKKTSYISLQLKRTCWRLVHSFFFPLPFSENHSCGPFPWVSFGRQKKFPHFGWLPPPTREGTASSFFLTLLLRALASHTHPPSCPLPRRARPHPHRCRPVAILSTKQLLPSPSSPISIPSVHPFSILETHFAQPDDNWSTAKAYGGAHKDEAHLELSGEQPQSAAVGTAEGSGHLLTRQPHRWRWPPLPSIHTLARTSTARNVKRGILARARRIGDGCV